MSNDDRQERQQLDNNLRNKRGSEMMYNKSNVMSQDAFEIKDKKNDCFSANNSVSLTSQSISTSHRKSVKSKVKNKMTGHVKDQDGAIESK